MGSVVAYWTEAPPKIIAERSLFSIGVDLGQKRDHTAVAVMESAEVTYDVRDPVTYQFRTERRYRLRHVERVRLGTPYPDVVAMLRQLTNLPELARRSTLVVDATGVGAPVVDLLRRGGLGCTVVAVTITGGLAATSDGCSHHVPKRDLMAGVQVLLGDARFSIAKGLKDGEALVEELLGVRLRRGGRMEGTKGDLVLALALAWWWTRKAGDGVHGTKRLL